MDESHLRLDFKDIFGKYEFKPHIHDMFKPKIHSFVIESKHNTT